MGHTTTNPNRAGEISRTGTAGAFLAPGLATREIHIALGLGAGCSTAAGGLDRHDDIVHGLVALGLVGDEFKPKQLGGDLARKIVAGRAEATGHDDRVAASDRFLDRFADRRAIGHGRLSRDAQTEFEKLAAKPCAVGVDGVSKQ